MSLRYPKWLTISINLAPRLLELRWLDLSANGLKDAAVAGTWAGLRGLGFSVSGVVRGCAL